jgi:hypothetical protein
MRRVTLHLISSTLRVVGLALFSLGFPLLLIPWIVSLLIAKVLTRAGIYLNTIGKNILFPDADTLLRSDERSIVLYLRAFRNAGADANKSPIPFVLFPAILTTSDEQRLSAIMNQLGPFITIGEKQGRDLGAARLYVTDDSWREIVTGLIPKAQLVVFRIDPSQEQWGLFSGKHEQKQWALGKSLQLAILQPNDIPEGVWDELEIAAETIASERILLYLPFSGSNSKRAEQYESVRPLLEKHLKRPFPEIESFGQARFIGFRPDGDAYLLENRRFSFFGIVDWSSLALRPVFTNIGASSPRVTVDYFRIIELMFGLVAAWPILLVLWIVILIIARSLRG